MSLHTLIECECVEGKERKKVKSQVFELLDTQEQLRHESEEMSLLLTKKDTNIVQLKSQLAKASQEGLGSGNISFLMTQNA